MKYDMSGGASVLEAMGAIAGLGLPVDAVAVVGATDNMVDGAAMVPGDVVRTAAGLTVEILNTDAEGRLVLADCLHHAVASEGAERLLDLATLTGGARTALGSVHCALLADDDPWCAEVEAAAAASGERVWRLPLHPRYAEGLRSRVADLANHVEGRQAAPIVAAAFLHRFTGGVPWAHVDVTAAATSACPTPPRAGRAGACGCWWSWRRPTPRVPPDRRGNTSFTRRRGSEPRFPPVPPFLEALTMNHPVDAPLGAPAGTQPPQPAAEGGADGQAPGQHPPQLHPRRGRGRHEHRRRALRPRPGRPGRPRRAGRGRGPTTRRSASSTPSRRPSRTRSRSPRASPGRS
jgi:hypothetical protein